MHPVRRTLIALLLVALVALPGVPPAPAGAGPAAVGAGAERSDPLPPGDCPPPFPDVPCDAHAYGAVRWAAEEGLVGGFGDGTFRPTGSISRQGLVALLHRQAGAPAGPFDPPGFPDVPEDHPFADAIAWAVSEGLAGGYGDGTFRPAQTVTRQTMAAFLHRRVGAPAGPFDPPGFADVPEDHPFADAIAWLAAAGLAAGFPDGTFRPAAPQQRQHAATFLAREAVGQEFDPATADRCEFLAPEDCLLVFPSDHFTREDPTTDTGLRLDLHVDSMPRSVGGVPVDPSGINASDGFSPGSMVLARIPGVDLAASGAPAIGRIARSLEFDSPIVIVDADSGERHPFWAELDSAGTTEADTSLHLRPAVNFREGHRYVVAMRRLVDTGGDPVEPSLAFRAYRDAIPTLAPGLEERRAGLEDVFGVLATAGVDRHDLFLAWDFTVASQRSLSERLLHIRDDAFADLGDEAPTFAVTSVVEPTEGEDPDIARRVEVTVEVPLYLTGAGEPGSQFNWGEGGLPARNGTFTAAVTCRVPRAASAEDPARISLYGHGLLGARTEVNAGNVRAFAQEHNIVFCATDWIGMANGDLVNVAGILSDLSRFPTLADRVQQGILNTLFLGRLMKHEDGLVSHPAFQDGGEPLIDTSELFYDSNSQGAIIGGAATAVAQDWTRAVLGVPGMNYSLLLKRSSDWPLYETLMASAYPDKLDQAIGLALIQIMWDRAETNGYAAHLTTDPYPDTPEHQVLLHVAFADHQVSMWAAEIEARTIGAHVRQPALAEGRHPDEEPLWNLPAVPGDGFTGSVLVYWDSGTPPPPQTNQQPTEGADPHGRPRAQASARAQKSAFFDGTFVDVCAGAPCLAP